jgi:putative addiction module component (TIGR02574 family)
MAANFDDIIKDALSLPPGARAMLADHLLESLDWEQKKEIDEAWAMEAERRMQEIRDGTVQTIDGEEVMRELRARRNR